MEKKNISKIIFVIGFVAAGALAWVYSKNVSTNSSEKVEENSRVNKGTVLEANDPENFLYRPNLDPNLERKSDMSETMYEADFDGGRHKKKKSKRRKTKSKRRKTRQHK